MNTLIDLFITTFKVGSLTFGGGYAMIPVLQHEFVDARGWLTAREFADGIAVGQVTPGPLMLMVAFMGYKIAGIVGALLASIGLFLPTFLLVILVGRMRERFSQNSLWQSAMKGIGMAVVGLLLAAAVLLALNAVIGSFDSAQDKNWLLVIISAASFLLIYWRKVDASWVILGAAIVGGLILH